jgi:hypothetical protein
MKVLKLFCLILILLNVAIFDLCLFPRPRQGFKAIVPVKYAGTTIEKPTGKAVSFREYSGAIVSSLVPSQNTEAIDGAPKILSAEIIDKGNLIYLGQMKGNDARNVFFFKDKRTNRVCSTADSRDLIKLISQSDSSLLVEIGGVTYEALR